MTAMARPILSVEACSLYGLTHLSGGHLRRQVPSVSSKTVYLSSVRRLVCKAVQGDFANGAASTSMTVSATDLHTQQAWEFWRRIGSPKYHVAPMVDQVSLAAVALSSSIGWLLLAPNFAPFLAAVRTSLQTVVPALWSHRSVHPNVAQQAVPGGSQIQG